MTEWVVLGAGGHARALVDVIARRGDRLVAVAGTACGVWDVPVLRTDEEALRLAEVSGAALALGIGDGSTRLHALEMVLAAGLPAPALVASTATVSTTAFLGAGVAVLEHAHVGPGAHLDEAVLVNTAGVVEHDVVVGRGTHVAPSAVLLGAATVGELSLLGASATVLPGVQVGPRCVVGAGAVVREDVDAGRTVMGVPARSVRG